MKLTSTAVKQTLDQFNAQAVPDNHPAVEQLNSLFGDHTFFLDGEGLHIVEPGEPTQSGEQTGQVVQLAAWQNAERTNLVPQEPEVKDVVVVLASDGPDAA